MRVGFCPMRVVLYAVRGAIFIARAAMVASCFRCGGVEISAFFPVMHYPVIGLFFRARLELETVFNRS
jgi:hypothetical protein